MENNFSTLQIDELSEIANIGAGNAATALSHMIAKKVTMSTPTSFIGDIVKIHSQIGSTDDLVLAVFLKMYGDIEGALVMIFPKDSALSFSNILNKKSLLDIKELTEEDKSSLKEIGNILLGASITALGKFLNLNILHSIPDVEVDMLGAVTDSLLVEMGGEADKVLCFRIKLTLDNEQIGSDLFYFFDPKSSRRILEITDQKMTGVNKP